MKKRIEVNGKAIENWELAWATTQGKRSSNEDSICIESEYRSSEVGLESFFVAVFDGHNGPRCSKFLAKEVFLGWQETMLEKQGAIEDDVIVKLFKEVDKKWLDQAALEGWKDGSTGICAAISEGELVVANVGDSRALLCDDGKTIVLSNDHKPTCEKEAERIEKNGGKVIGGRLQAALDVSRSFGDIDFKKENYLSSEPELTRHTLSMDSEFLVVSSDGLYEVFTNDEVIEWIRKGLKTKDVRLSDLAKDLVEEALDRGSADNISLIIVKFEKAFKKYLKKHKKSSSKKQSLLPLSPKGLSLRSSGKIPLHNHLNPQENPPMVRSTEPRKSLKTSGKHKLTSKSATNSSIPSPLLTPVSRSPSHNSPSHSPSSRSPSHNSPTSSPTSSRSFLFAPSENPSPCSLMHKLNGVVEPYLEEQKKKSKSKLKKKEKEKIVKIDKDTPINDKPRNPHPSQSTSLRNSGRSILTKSG